MSKEFPKKDTTEEGFVFVTSHDSFSHLYDWDASWNREMVKQCQELIKRLNWKQDTELNNEQDRLTWAFNEAFNREHQEAIDHFGERQDLVQDFEKIKNANKSGLKVTLLRAITLIKDGIAPKFMTPKELGTLLERMVGFLESN